MACRDGGAVGGFVRCVCVCIVRCVVSAVGDGMQCIGKLRGVNDRP